VGEGGQKAEVVSENFWVIQISSHLKIPDFYLNDQDLTFIIYACIYVYTIIKAALAKLKEFNIDSMNRYS
jgi:hypothetical protein